MKGSEGLVLGLSVITAFVIFSIAITGAVGAQTLTNKVLTATDKKITEIYK